LHGDEERIDGNTLSRRMRRRVTWVALLSNSLGALFVFAFAGFVVPGDVDPDEAAEQLRLSAPVALVYLALALPLGVLHSRPYAAAIDRWLATDRTPTDAERRFALRLPVRVAGISAVFWGIAVLLFGFLQLRVSVELALTVGLSVLLGGVTTCAIAYLLSERTWRPVVAAALRMGPPDRPLTPGIRARFTMAWALATGVPLLGIAAVGIQGLSGDLDRLVPISALVLAVFGLGAGLLAINLAARSVADPVAAVRDAVARVERGDYDAQLPIDDGSEVGLLEAGFNRMALGLRERERMRDLFGRQVGKDVARAALEGEFELGGEAREVAAVFVDLIGSTALAYQRPATEVVALLNGFLKLVVEVIEANGGWVNKFEGDAALAIFGAPVSQRDPGGDALRAARLLRERIDSELSELDAGIGVSAGTAVAGNIGAEERYEYTVIGDPVNEAARLCELAKERDARLIASEAVVSWAGGESRNWALGESVALRGRESQTRIATVQPRH
jgi:adenylate cyclase